MGNFFVYLTFLLVVLFITWGCTTRILKVYTINRPQEEQNFVSLFFATAAVSYIAPSVGWFVIQVYNCLSWPSEYINIEISVLPLYLYTYCAPIFIYVLYVITTKLLNAYKENRSYLIGSCVKSSLITSGITVVFHLFYIYKIELEPYTYKFIIGYMVVAILLNIWMWLRYKTVFNPSKAKPVQSVTQSQPVVSTSDTNKEIRLCPYCGEKILMSAKKCKHCKSWLVEQPEK